VVVLLDIKLPLVNGLDVLKAIRSRDSTKHLPVVMLTSSDEQSDRKAAYEHFANSYVRKPVDYDDFVNASRRLGLYWTVTNVPPPPGC
jgi:two-component system response regulator